MVLRRLYEVSLFGHAARKKPCINKVNHGKRITFAKILEEKPPSFWDNVLWSDESKYNLFVSDGNVVVWRIPKEKLDPKCTVPTLKHAAGKVKS